MSRRPTARIAPLRDFEAFRDLIAGYQLPRVLLTALELDLFTAIGARSWTVEALAKEIRVSERGLDILCRNLASAGVLLKQGGRYRNGRVAATALNAKSTDYRSGYLGLLRDHWRDWGQFTESVRSGRPVEDDTPHDDDDYRRRFTWAMHHRSIDTAPGVAKQIDLRRARRLLDLGGGPGTYALAFLKKNPTLTATVADRAPALDVAKEIAASVRQGARLSYLPLDFLADDIPGTYDVVWYSNVLHIYSAEQNRTIFKKVATRLEPGGRLFIQDAFLVDREGLYPPDANLFAATMLLFTESGNTYTVAATRDWLREAGFEKIRLVPLKKGTGDWENGLLEARVGRSRRGTPGRRR